MEQQSQKIGDLTNGIVNSVASKVSATPTSTELQTTSETTGSECPVPVDERETGTRRGETGFAVTLRTVGPAALVGLGYKEADEKIVASLPQRLRSQIAPRYRDYTASDGQFETELVGYEIPAEATDEERREALAVLNAVNDCPTVQDIAKQIAKLGELTKRRSTDDDEFVVAAYAEQLAEYPLDVIVDACRHWANTEVFFPSWAELKDLLDWRVRKRRRLRDSMRAAAANSGRHCES